VSLGLVSLVHDAVDTEQTVVVLTLVALPVEGDTSGAC
jgi:hypothetical protein